MYFVEGKCGMVVRGKCVFCRGQICIQVKANKLSFYKQCKKKTGFLGVWVYKTKLLNEYVFFFKLNNMMTKYHSCIVWMTANIRRRRRNSISEHRLFTHNTLIVL